MPLSNSICASISVLVCAAGFSGALSQPGSHSPVHGHQQGASVDTGERGACDGRSTSGPSLLSETPRFLPGCHGYTPPFPAPGRSLYRPEKPQVCHEAPVRDIRVEGEGRIMDIRKEQGGASDILILVLSGYLVLYLMVLQLIYLNFFSWLLWHSCHH